MPDGRLALNPRFFSAFRPVRPTRVHGDVPAPQAEPDNGCGPRPDGDPDRHVLDAGEVRIPPGVERSEMRSVPQDSLAQLDYCSGNAITVPR